MHFTPFSKRHGRLTWSARFVMFAVGALGAAACDDPASPAAPPSGAPTADRHGDAHADLSPHREGWVQSRGVALHYLDWGGKGPTLVLLTGLGDNAHIFDEMAPKLVPRYHVVAITRRGFGQSDKPATGYDVNTLVDDDVAVLDALGESRIYLAGHSIAGPEMTRLAVRYPERVARLAYIDASLNDRGPCDPSVTAMAARGAMRDAPLATRARVTASELPTQLDILSPPPPDAADLESFAAVIDYRRRNTAAPWTKAYENGLRHELTFDAQGHVTGSTTPDAVIMQVLDGACRYRHEFSQLRMPALAIGERPGTIFDLFPWLPATVSGDSLSAAQWFLAATLEQMPHMNDDLLASVPDARVLVIPNSIHYVFIRHEKEVIAALRDFLPARPIDKPRARDRS